MSPDTNLAPMQTLGSRSALELGSLVALVTFGLAAVLGAIAVLDADHVASGFGIGLGVAFLVFAAGATVVCALACLARGKAELLALASVIVAGVALDLLVLAIWRDIDSETYGKVVGIGLVWSFSRTAGVRADARGEQPGQGSHAGRSSGLSGRSPGRPDLDVSHRDRGRHHRRSGRHDHDRRVPVSSSDDELLRVLGLAFVLIATFWFGAIAAHRYEQALARAADAQTLKLMLRSSGRRLAPAASAGSRRAGEPTTAGAAGRPGT